MFLFDRISMSETLLQCIAGSNSSSTSISLCVRACIVAGKIAGGSSDNTKIDILFKNNIQLYINILINVDHVK